MVQREGTDAETREGEALSIIRLWCPEPFTTVKTSTSFNRAFTVRFKKGVKQKQLLWESGGGRGGGGVTCPLVYSVWTRNTE